MNSATDGTAHILIVDDETPIAKFLAEVCQRSGYSCDWFDDSEQALTQFKQNPEIYSLVITDQSMPKLNGIDFAVEVLSLRIDMPIIMCTGFTDIIYQQRSGELNIEHFLTKPVGVKELATKLSAILPLSRKA